jgi:ABC-type lipoprotein export system ATPase subunit
MTPVLVLDGVTKSYGDVRALDDVSLRVDAGEIVALVGPSGSGKTTVLNIVAGWEQADGGAARHGAPDDRWQHIAVVPQAASLLTDLTLIENVALPARIAASHLVRPDEPKRLLAALGLAELADRIPSELSHGEQQRGALARALVLRPLLLVADEPTSHLDHRATKRVLDVLRAAADGGTACLLATHDPAVLDVADRVVRLRDGRNEP